MFEALSKPQWKRTLLLLVICGVLAAAAGVVGISDNLVGLSLAVLSAIALVLAFVHPWTSRQFRRLIYASVLGFVVFAVLSNVFHGGVAGIFFLIAVLLCPAGLLVGIIGAVVTSGRERHSRAASPVA